MADWIGINSSHYDSHCGDDGSHTVEEALDGTNYWNHDVSEIHYVILDLGAEYNITKIRGRSDESRDPTDIDVYINNTGSDPWGDAVASEITTWQDTSDWVEIDCTDKEGRFIKIVINDTEYFDRLHFGKSVTSFSIFDAYGELARISLSGQSDITISCSGELTVRGPQQMSGQAAIVFSNSGSLSVKKLLSGSAAISISAIGTLRGTNQMVGQSDLSISCSGSLSVKKRFIGSTMISFSTTGNLRFQGIYLQGSAAINLTTTAYMFKFAAFPSLSASPRMELFIDEYSDETIIIDSYASGYPCINPQFDFDPRNFKPLLYYVSQTDKETLAAFYNNHKKDIIRWLNEQENKYYDVIFTGKPSCRLAGSKEEWDIELYFRQISEK